MALFDKRLGFEFIRCLTILRMLLNIDLHLLSLYQLMLASKRSAGLAVIIKIGFIINLVLYSLN